MADFKNELSWSTSRRKLWEGCRRAYWYRYYGHWGGWKSEAPPRIQKAWMLGKMTRLHMWTGSIVHETLEEALKEYAATGTFPDRVRMEERAIHRLRRGWVESRDREWERDPRRCVNLMEHYYHHPIHKEDTDKVKADVLLCLRNFDASKTAGELRASDPASWLNLEVLDSFPVDGVKVYIKPDLACRQGDKVVLYDWKTGRRNPDDLRQLAAYALFARHRWGASAEDILIRAVYLKEGEVVEAQVEEALLVEIEQEITASIAEMRQVLRDPAQNIAAAEDFPRVDQAGECRNCFFQELCYGEGGYPGEE